MDNRQTCTICNEIISSGYWTILTDGSLAFTCLDCKGLLH